jgi:peptide deformylase
MAILEIAKYPAEEKRLRERCKPILKITNKTRKLIEDMIDTMYEAAGVGLAAPQVFVGQRLFVYDIGEGPDALINPEILQAEGEEIGPEGCLSIPRLQGDVCRNTRITVTGINRKGRPVRIEAEDYLARVFQHEIDHLNGILFVDRAVEKTLHYITEEEDAERKQEGRKRRVIRRVNAPHEAAQPAE